MAMEASDTGWSDMSPANWSVNTTTATDSPRSPQRRPQSYTETDWDEKKQIIKYLFLDLNMTLPAVVEALSIDYDFHSKYGGHLSNLPPKPC